MSLAADGRTLAVGSVGTGLVRVYTLTLADPDGALTAGQWSPIGGDIILTQVSAGMSVSVLKDGNAVAVGPWNSNDGSDSGPVRVGLGSG